MTRSASLRSLLCWAFGVVATTAVAGEITLYEGENFQGRSLTLRGETRNFDRTTFNDRASSLVVRDGVWEVCTDAYFAGRCVTLRPGEYPVLEGGLDRRISSARQVADAPAVGYGAPPQGYAAAPGYGSPGYAPSRGPAKAILYEGPDFRGRAFAIERNIVRNLEPTGFNDRAASLRVERGYWIFCSDANFEGECLTFGPGDYPNLPGELNRRISSGRMIHDRYPYSAPPAWNRG
ncbi:MAG: beta/gamma crystallin family protein [Pseudomonadota bacterium]|nr:beta/gamma crystallin family protein [Pseudomonadota bacterium]